MKIVLLFSISMFLCFGNLNAQTFARTYKYPVSGGAGIPQILQVDQGYILADIYRPGSGQYTRINLIKVDLNGDTLWTHIISAGDSSSCNVEDLKAVDDSNFIITGHWKYNTPMDSTEGICLIKFDYMGNIVWNKLFLDSIIPINYQGNNVTKTYDNGFLICSYNKLIRTDSLGEHLWSKCYPTVYNGNFAKCIEVSDSGFVMVGNEPNHDSTIVSKVDINGNLMWRKLFSGTFGYLDLIPGNNNNVLVATNHYIFYINSTGDTLWTRMLATWGPMMIILPTSLANSVSGDFLITGLSRSTAPSYALLKVDTNGILKWGRELSHFGNNNPLGVLETSDGGYLMGSVLWTSFGDYSPTLIKVDSLFNITCEISDSFSLSSIGGFQGQIINDTNLVVIPNSITMYYPQSWSIYHGCEIIDLCSTSDIETTNDISELNIYPNPSTGNIHFTNEINKLEVYSLIGEKVAEYYDINSNESIDLSDYSTGIYTCKATLENHQVRLMKLILF